MGFFFVCLGLADRDTANIENAAVTDRDKVAVGLFVGAYILNLK